MLRRIVQIGAGKIFGSRAFVEATVGANARALPRGALARTVMSGVFASHGWKLVREEMTFASGKCLLSKALKRREGRRNWIARMVPIRVPVMRQI